MLCENIGTSTSIDVTEQEEADFNGNSECQIPMVVFSAPKQEEDVPTETTDDECDEDCESFNPADLMTFAWQIARGMVGKNFILYQRTNLVQPCSSSVVHSSVVQP